MSYRSTILQVALGCMETLVGVQTLCLDACLWWFPHR